jgi:hypothetical protein
MIFLPSTPALAGKAGLAALLLAFEVDGINGHAGTVGRVHRVVQRLLAAAVHAVGEDNQRLAAILGLHQLIGSEEDRIVKQRAGPAAATLTLRSAAVSAGIRTLRVVLGGAGRAHIIQLVVQLVARGGEVTEQLDLAVEVDEEGLVRGGAGPWFGRLRQHCIDKFARRLALVLHGAGDAAAGVDEQAQPEGQLGLVGKALDGLRAAILGQGEVFDLEAGHQRAVFVAHRDGQHDLAGLNLQGGDGLVGRLRGRAGRGQTDQGQQRDRQAQNESDSHSGQRAHTLTPLDERACGVLTVLVLGANSIPSAAKQAAEKGL